MKVSRIRNPPQQQQQSSSRFHVKFWELESLGLVVNKMKSTKGKHTISHVDNLPSFVSIWLNPFTEGLSKLMPNTPLSRFFTKAFSRKGRPPSSPLTLSCWRSLTSLVLFDLNVVKLSYGEHMMKAGQQAAMDHKEDLITPSACWQSLLRH